MIIEQTQKTRILVDLQGCQTHGSHMRGVGQYSRELFHAMARTSGSNELYGLMSLTLPFDPGINNFPFSKMLQLPSLPEWHTSRNYDGGQKDRLDTVAYCGLANQIKPDVIHVSSLIEGYSDRVPLPTRECLAPGQILSATLYDFIPSLFPTNYLEDPVRRSIYMSRLSWLRQADLLLAISESTRQDALDLLNISPERIVTIGGGISPVYKPLKNRQEARKRLAQRYKLRPKIVLYTGGDDFRKNIQGALSGFAALPPVLRQDCQLVIVCEMPLERHKFYKTIATQVGLSPEDVLFTGYIPEHDLIDFYNACDVFIFPSLYEGLGFPILEAMACGAPVIGSNNSSIKEIIQRSEALFDPRSETSIAEALIKVLTNENFAEELRHHGLARSKEFSWSKTSSLALEAMTEARARGGEKAIQVTCNGWLPRKRIAMLTPLPPCRSGIADYNAQFLPFLARHLDIDLFIEGDTVDDEALLSTFRIFNIQDFEHVAHNYDAILYEFGNSEFHAHMVPLLKRYPGIVGLHDAFLNGLFHYIDYALGETGRYTQELLKAHGPQAKKFLAPTANHPDPLDGTIRGLPCTKGILDLATGIISHSPFNEKLACHFYPEGFQAPYRTIPQAILCPKLPSLLERATIRTTLGLTEDSFVIATFGHIVWTKGGDILLKAFHKLLKKQKKRIDLIYVGELSKNTFGMTLKKMIAHAKLKNNVHITGFLPESEYKKYLYAADLAVQLRIQSRGGTPRGVLDCLAHGLPVVVNNDASYTDYPDDAVIKIDAHSSVEELTEILHSFLVSPKKRARFSTRGRQYVQSRHQPESCAAAYATAIHEFIERQRFASPAGIATAFVPYLAATEEPQIDCDAAVDWIEALNPHYFSKRTIFIDVSHILQKDYETGIQRVVKKITRALSLSNATGFEPIVVQWRDNQFRVASTWLQAQKLHCLHEPEPSDSAIVFKAGDILLMLDSSWEQYSSFEEEFQRARAAKAQVFTVIYDLLPILLPPGNFVQGGREWFERWLKKAIAWSDGVVCISKAVAEDIRAYITTQNFSSPQPKIGYWHLGADFIDPEVLPKTPIRHSLPATPYLLMVGTLEPRKNHALTLEAFEILWNRGIPLSLCIAGKEGWCMEAFMQRLQNHPYLQKRLFFFKKPSDLELCRFYKQAAGFLFLSKGEGFGLPLIEAAHYGVPLICSDLPVFRESATEFATYITLGDAYAVANQLESWWKKYQAGELPKSQDMPSFTWEESANALLDVILGNKWMEN